MSAPQPSGTVYLIGAGPGDPELIAVKGQRCLSQAQVVVYDYLANPALLEALPPQVQTVYVGKRHGEHAFRQDEINQMLISYAPAGLEAYFFEVGQTFEGELPPKPTKEVIDMLLEAGPRCGIEFVLPEE